MSPSFLVKLLCYAWRPFTITLASSAFISVCRRPVSYEWYHRHGLMSLISKLKLAQLPKGRDEIKGFPAQSLKYNRCWDE